MPRLPFDGTFPLTQAWGEHPEWYSRFGLPGHNGLDYGCPTDTPILACEEGEVWESALDVGGYGFYVKVRGPDAAEWIYAHLRPWALPRPGTYLAEGQMLGYSDNSGFSTGPHLHVGYRPDWRDRSGAYAGLAPPPLTQPRP